VIRATIILLAVEGKSNAFIADDLHITRDSVILWRQRWSTPQEKFHPIEPQNQGKALLRAIIETLSDPRRPGAPVIFTAEQVCQIIALACESPHPSGRPISHWSDRDLTDEVIKRQMAPSISVRTVGRFLKSGATQAPSHAKLGVSRKFGCPRL
jgi:putative transposase